MEEAIQLAITYNLAVSAKERPDLDDGHTGIVVDYK